MAQLSTEQSAYIASQQQYLSDLKVSQFAKFLEKNPIYVTYYVVNQAQSSADAGTGAIQMEIGPHSPLKFNKVLQVPAFNVPELRPDVIQDEGGYDTEMDLNDITFVPGTVRPKPADYMRLDIPGVVPLLFRCNNFRHNTIRSNDYYMGDFDLVDINQRYLKLIEAQVVETYTCHFENIGTNQKVLLTSVEEESIADLQGLIDQLCGFYQEAFYNAEVDGFVLYDAGLGNDPGLNGNGGVGSLGTQWYYDNYLTRFLNESEIFRNDKSDTTLVLPYLELLPLNFDFLYGRSLWRAVLQRNKEALHPYLYAWSRLVQKRTSPLMLGSHPTLHPTLELFDHFVPPQEPVPADLKGMVWTPGEPCGWNGYDPSLRTYFGYNLLHSLEMGVPMGPLNMVEKMIFDYITAGLDSVTFTRKELLQFAFRQDLFTYMHLPLVIYLLKQQLASQASA